MRLTYIYFLIVVTQGSHDFRFDMGRMGIRAGKLTSPESSTKRYWFYLCAICVRALIKTGKPSALISALHSRKALSFKDIAEVSEQISHLLNCAMENNRKRKLQYLFSHVTLEWLLSKNRYRSASFTIALPITGFSRSDLALDLHLEPCFQKKDSWSKISLICIIFIPQD